MYNNYIYIYYNILFIQYNYNWKLRFHTKIKIYIFNNYMNYKLKVNSYQFQKIRLYIN